MSNKDRYEHLQKQIDSLLDAMCSNRDAIKLLLDEHRLEYKRIIETDFFGCDEHKTMLVKKKK